MAKKQTRRQSPNPTGLAKDWPEDIEFYRRSLLARFQREYTGERGLKREKARQAFMYRHFYSHLKPNRIYQQVGLTVEKMVKETSKNGQEPIDVLREIIRYANND